jgi:tryptophan synthase alpha chain
VSSVLAARFDTAFAGRGGVAVIPYFTAGFPRRDSTASLLLAAQEAGCIAVEVGIPFSDPLADGPTIQRTGWSALQQGMTLPLAIEQTAEARSRGLRLAVAFMTYVNPVLSHGVDAFARDAAGCGADGVIVPDLPAEEAHELRAALQAQGLALIPLIAPTTPRERIARCVDGAAGFVYCVGVTGVTGARPAVAEDALRLLAAVRTVTPLPRALGFGISRPEHVRALAGHAEAAVVGSALLEAITRSSDAEREAVRFLGEMVSAGA